MSQTMKLHWIVDVEWQLNKFWIRRTIQLSNSYFEILNKNLALWNGGLRSFGFKILVKASKSW